MPSFQKPSFGKPKSARKSENPGVMARNEAEAIALSALVFVAEDPARLSRFLNDTGVMPADLAAAAGSPHMLVAVLDHLMADESLLLVFAAQAAIEPTAVAAAQHSLATTG